MKKLVLETKDVANNMQVIRNTAFGCAVIGVVKGNGYGFGQVPFAGLLQKCGADMLAVSNIDEARELREGGIQGEILLLTPSENADTVKAAVELDLTVTIASAQGAILLENAAGDKKIKAHIALDTGMGRFGFLPDATEELCAVLSTLKSVEVEGVFSHLSCAFVKKSKKTAEQILLFGTAVKALEEKGFKFKYIHLANSCAVFTAPDGHFTAVRVGSALIGRLPKGIGKGLKVCGTLEASLDNPRHLPAGHTVGYAATYKTKKITKIAVADIGYADGFAHRKALETYRVSDRLRNLKDAIFFLIKPSRLICRINGKKAKILGRVGMTNCVVDISRVEGFTAGMCAQFNVNPIYVNQNVEREYR